VSRTAAIFRQSDVTRAVRAVRAAGLDVYRTEIAPDGRIVIIHHLERKSEPTSELDLELAEFEARHDDD
jgi:hypothetical protein